LEKKAYVFPGQGSQFVGMGKDLYANYPLAKDLFDRANTIMDTDLARICFEGPEEELKQTQITQPAIFVHSMVVFELIRNAAPLPVAVAGHSLGEYSALVAAGALEFEEGLQLVKIRGSLMAQAGKIHTGTMAAIIGLDGPQVDQVCKQAEAAGIVCTANYNSPGQIVISGEVGAVRAAMELAKSSGAKRAIELVVSGAFHSPLMENAAGGLLHALQSAGIKRASIPVYSNVQATAVNEAEEIRDLLYQQLTHPVRWQEIIEHMAAAGMTTVVEIGPGRVLSGLNRRIVRELNTAAIGTAEEVAALLNT
jgi:[acyl-carrier-protein] S-malonyltransferase